VAERLVLKKLGGRGFCRMAGAHHFSGVKWIRKKLTSKFFYQAGKQI
jgi:hypothetical protein